MLIVNLKIRKNHFIILEESKWHPLFKWPKLKKKQEKQKINLNSYQRLNLNEKET